MRCCTHSLGTVTIGRWRWKWNANKEMESRTERLIDCVNTL